MFITPQEGPEARRHQPDAAVRLRRLQHLADAGVLGQPAGVAGDGRRLRAWPTCAAAASTARTGTRPARSCKKQNVFDDFIAAAEYLIKEKYTQPDEAGDPGRQQRRPAGRRVHDAAAGPVRRVPAGGRRDGHAALPEVHRRPLLGRRLRLVATTRRSSRRCTRTRPYHNLQERRDEVPGDAGDDGRHRRPRGAGAQLQVRGGAAGDARPARRPVLVRIETQAGHGAGKPTTKLIEETADQWAFLVKNLGMKP